MLVRGFARMLSARIPLALRIACVALCAFAARPAVAGELQDFVRLRGLEGDTLVGLGLVTGLNGTGDSMKDSSIAGQPYAQLLRRLGNVSALRGDMLKTKSVAIVYVTARIPYGGARIGDRIDVRLSTMGSAKSIEGGELVATYLLSDVVPADRSQWVPYGIAEGGPIEVDSVELGTVGSIRGGGKIVRDLVKSPFDGDSVYLILHEPYVGYPAATAIAGAVNEELMLSDISGAASVVDSQTIRVRVPETARSREEFLGDLLTTQVPGDLLRLRSRVVIDMRNKVMTIDESVEFRPTAVTADALRITTITPPLQPTPENPVATTTAWVGVATGAESKASMRLKDLIRTLERLEVPFETQVSIVESLERQGALKCQIVRMP